MNPAALVSIFVRHRNAANLLMALMLIAGIFGLIRLNTQLFPDFGIDMVSTTVVWSGASAEDVDANIVGAIEPEVRFLDDVKAVRSFSSEGVAFVLVEFETGTDMQAALSDVTAAVAGVTTLPEDAEKPLVKRAVRYDLISRMVVTGDVPERTLKTYAKKIRDELLLRGIDRVNFFGLRKDIVRVEVPAGTLRRINMTMGDVADHIAGVSLDLPDGNVKGASEKQLRTLGEVRNAEEFAELELKSGTGGERLVLGDIARVREDFDDNQPIGRYRGKPAIELSIQRATTTDALTVAAIVDDYMAEMQKTLPPSVKVIAYDTQSDLIEERINLLIVNGLGGLLLVLIILFVFLSGRVAFWVAAGIPTAILATAGVMLLTGQSINMVSLFAMIMTLGIIVDDAIVVGEHAATLRARGLRPRDAAEQGALRMLAPVVASALTTIAAFFPLFMIGDIIGQIIFAIPAVVVCVLIASLVECFFVLPGHLRGALRSIDPDAEAITRGARLRKAIDDGFERFRSGPFNRWVTTALHYRWSTLAAAIAVLLISIGLLSGGRVGFNFFPSPESETIDANIRLAAGTPREKSAEALQQVLAAMERADEKLRGDGDSLVVMSLARIGQSQGDAFSRISGDHLGGVQVQLTPSDHRTVRTSEFVKAWRQEVPPIEGLERLGLNERRGGPPGRDLDLRLRGADVNALLAGAEAAKAVFKQYAGVTDIKDDLPFGKQEIILELTPYGEALGLTTRNVANQVRGAFDGVIARRFARGDEEAEVRVQLPQDDATEAQIRSLHIRSPQGEEIPLEEVVTFREDAGFARIRRENAAREVSVVANIDTNVTSAVDVVGLMKASGEIARIAERHDLQYRFAGRNEEQQETFADMQLGATIGLSAIYIILAWVFSSYAKPLVVMSIIPFGLVGAVWGHYLMGFDLSILSLVALLGLSGILVNNSIILVTQIDEHLAAGKEYFDAIIAGSGDRLRAVSLTSLTTVGGLTPLMFERSLQAQFLIPMAITLVFGLAVASVLVLFVVPALLGCAQDLGRLVRWIFMKPAAE